MNEKAIEVAEANQSGFALAQRQAKAYASSTLVPKTFQNNMPNVLIAMEYANRTGASILSIMQQMYIVPGSGKPAFEAKFMIATVNACGRFTPIRYRFQGKQGDDDWGCRAYATDKASGEECAGPLVDWRMVKAEKWDKNPKWKSMPELMFYYRSAAFWSRVYAPELSMGMRTLDEVDDMGPIIDIGDATVVEESPTEARKAEVAERPVEVPRELNVFDELEFALSDRMPVQEKAKWIAKQCKKAGWDGAKLTEAQASALLDILNEGGQNGDGGDNQK